MENTSLEDVYESVNKDATTIFVVPLIRYDHQKTDYLYLLYKDLIDSGKYDIKSISVFNHFKLLTGILTQKNAILHYHWLEFQDLKSIFGMPWKILCIYLFRLFGGNIVWTLHNEFPHDQKNLRLHSFLHKKMAAWSDALHVHCSYAAEIMKDRLDVSKAKFHLIPHPEFPAENKSKKEARDFLKNKYELFFTESDRIALMFGNISYYKQIQEVAEIFINTDIEAYLLVVGPVKKGSQNLFTTLEELQLQHNNIKMVPDFIEEDEVPFFYCAADLCVFNYREILSSGGYHMAKAYHKKIVAPDMGCLSEKGSESNVQLFKTQQELAVLLKSHLNS